MKRPEGHHERQRKISEGIPVSRESIQTLRYGIARVSPSWTKSDEALNVNEKKDFLPLFVDLGGLLSEIDSKKLESAHMTVFHFPDKPLILYLSTIPNNRYIEEYDNTVRIHTKHQEDSIIHMQQLTYDSKGNCVRTQLFGDDGPMAVASVQKQFNGSGELFVGPKIGSLEETPAAVLVLDGCCFGESGLAAVRAVNLHI